MAQTRLKANCLGFTELLAQGIALISPTMTAALIVPVMYSNTGDWSWLSYALGTVMLLFVAYNLNQFARRSTGAGSMYAYTCRGLGLTAGGISGWALIWAYLGISMAGTTGASIFANTLLGMVGVHLPFVALFGACNLISWYCAWKNVQLSAVLMLILEGVSMAFILLLSVIVLSQHHFVLDTPQFQVSELPWSSVGLGVVVAIFSLVGFECATAFGDEARNPLRTIPKAVNWSLIISGVFFVFITYVEVLGTRGYSTTLDKIDAPLNVLAQLAHVPILEVILSLGAMVSFFALNLSTINAGGRVIYAMGRHGLFHSATADTHSTNETPHIAVTIMALIAFSVPSAALIGGVAPLDCFNYVGTCAAFGFMVAYTLVTIAAPVYLKRRGELKGKDIAGCAAALILLAIPAVGSVYPIPDPPVNYFPYGFLVYLAVGIVWIVSVYRRKPAAIAFVQEDLDRSHDLYVHEVEMPKAAHALPT
ncbi:MAG TPA: APC family permease [Stellaceae bacterium]|jgi:amino acid transporter|nr:APC family permease [Stellaceae bacterium]